MTYNRGSEEQEFPKNPPFQLNETTGIIMSTLEFDPEGDKTFRIPVQAHDQETLTSPVMNIIDGEVVVSSSHYTTLTHQAPIAAAADNMIQYMFFFFFILWRK